MLSISYLLILSNIAWWYIHIKTTPWGKPINIAYFWCTYSITYIFFMCFTFKNASTVCVKEREREKSHGLWNEPQCENHIREVNTQAGRTTANTSPRNNHTNLSMPRSSDSKSLGFAGHRGWDVWTSRLQLRKHSSNLEKSVYNHIQTKWLVL